MNKNDTQFFCNKVYSGSGRGTVCQMVSFAIIGIEVLVGA